MLKAKLETERGDAIYVLGLSEGNLRLLRERRPIQVDLREIGGTDTVVIMWGETEADMANEVQSVVAARNKDVGGDDGGSVTQ